MKKVFEYRLAEDPVFFSTLRKAYDRAVEDFGPGIPTYRTIQKHIREKGFFEMEVDWLSDYLVIVKREVL